MSGPELERVDCYHCDGTGEDSAAWDGRCPFCRGEGERYVPVCDDDLEDSWSDLEESWEGDRE